MRVVEWQNPKRGEERVMKKAILIICVLSTLALLVAAVAAEVVSLSKDHDGQADPEPVSPEGNSGAEEELDRQTPLDIFPFARV